MRVDESMKVVWMGVRKHVDQVDGSNAGGGGLTRGTDRVYAVPWKGQGCDWSE